MIKTENLRTVFRTEMVETVAVANVSIEIKKGEFVAIDNVGAGIGETVLVAEGSAARIGCDLENAPVDAAIVGIVDEN